MRRVPDFSVVNKGLPFLDEIAADPTGEGVDDKEENDSHSQMTENNNNISQTSRAFIIVELMEVIKLSSAKGQVLTVKDVVQVYDSRVNEIGKYDDRAYSTKRKWMKHCIFKYIPNIRFEQELGTNSSQRIISTNLDSLILKLANVNRVRWAWHIHPTESSESFAKGLPSLQEI